MRYYGVVERSKSPAFQLIDTFPDRYAQRSREIAVGQWYERDVKDGLNDYRFIWDAQTTKFGIQNLRHELSELFSAQRASALDSDEFGNTLLHVSVSCSLRARDC